MRIVAHARKIFVNWVLLDDAERVEDASRGVNPLVIERFSAPWVPRHADDIQWIPNPNLTPDEARTAEIHYKIALVCLPDTRDALVRFQVLRPGGGLAGGIDRRGLPWMTGGGIDWSAFYRYDHLTPRERAREIWARINNNALVPGLWIPETERRAIMDSRQHSAQRASSSWEQPRPAASSRGDTWGRQSWDASRWQSSRGWEDSRRGWEDSRRPW